MQNSIATQHGSTTTSISVFGLGYVGLVTALCFSEMGFDVIGCDVDSDKIRGLKNLKTPFFEPGLYNLLEENLKNEQIHFTDNLEVAIRESSVLMICVGTPLNEKSEADLSQVDFVLGAIAKHINSFKSVVIKSTVPVGTCRRAFEVIRATNPNCNFEVASNPEFLREGSAIEDTMKPSRVLVGCDHTRTTEVLRRLYEPFLKNGNPFIVMSPESSEMSKYAANCMLALRISYMNQLSQLCERTNADIEEVRKGIGSDPRIGPNFIYAGVGFGGSCFPKDTRAFSAWAKNLDVNLSLVTQTIEANQLQKQKVLDRILKCLKSPSSIITFWGVAFKAGTDDIREAPSIFFAEELLRLGYRIQIFDPLANENFKTCFAGASGIEVYTNQYEATSNSSLLVVLTEHKSFRTPNFQKLQSLMKEYQVFDGRNVYNPRIIQEAGFNYFGIGRSK